MGSSLMVSESRGLESGVWEGTCPQRQQGKELGASRTTGSLVDGGTPVPRPGPWTQKRVLAGLDQEKKFQGLGWAPSAQRSYTEPTLCQTLDIRVPENPSDGSTGSTASRQALGPPSPPSEVCCGSGSKPSTELGASSGAHQEMAASVSQAGASPE